MSNLIDIDDGINLRLKWVEQFWDTLGEVFPVIDRDDVDDLHPQLDWMGDLFEEFMLQDNPQTLDERAQAMARAMNDLHQEHLSVLRQFLISHPEVARAMEQRCSKMLQHTKKTTYDLLDVYLQGRPRTSKVVPPSDEHIEYLERQSFRPTMRQLMYPHWAVLVDVIAQWVGLRAETHLGVEAVDLKQLAEDLKTLDGDDIPQELSRKLNKVWRKK